jgi:Ca2+-binding RTX toxin-like protein
MARRTRPLRFERLETRRLLTFAAQGDIVGIKGTHGDDAIRVELSSDGQFLNLTLNNEHASYSYSRPYGSPYIRRVLILGEAGNNQITIADDFPIDALIDAGSGDDIVTTSKRNDIILGGAGKDKISSDAGDDKIDGGAGDDTIDCGDGNDSVIGGKGSDTIHGGAGNDVVGGQAGIDALYGDEGDDLIGGGAGNDVVFGGDGKDAVFGDIGNDLLVGDGDADHLDGAKGNDRCFGGMGDDQLKGGVGRDLLDGESGNNLIDTPEPIDTPLNGLITDINVECRAVFVDPSTQKTSFAEYDVQNVDGHVEYTFRIVVNDYYDGNIVDPFFIDGRPAGTIYKSVRNDGTAEFSTNPDAGLLGFPAESPTIHSGSIIQVGDRLVGTFVSTYVI